MTLKMAGMNEANRYNRQQLIEGWDQAKLTKATVSVVGSDALARYVAIPLVALGVGRVRLVDDSLVDDELLLDMELKGKFAGRSRVSSLEEGLGVMNPTVETHGISSRIAGRLSGYFLRGSNIVVDATNNPYSKAVVQAFCHEEKDKIPFISAASMPGFGAMVAHYPLRHEATDLRTLLYKFEGPQDQFVGMVLGGMIAEEVKKMLMGQNDDSLQHPVYYNLTSRERFSYELIGKMPATGAKEFAGKKALIIGAGALGNFVALGLANLGVGRVDVIDPDTVEDTNLNRQVLYYDSVGKPKAEALSAKIRTIGRGSVRSDAMIDVFHEKSEFRAAYDIVMDCVDNFTVRAVISDYAIAHATPLISGGTNFASGQTVIYVPGVTACMDCQMNIHELGRVAEERRKKVGCLEAPNPSVIMTNQVIGGMMVNEARTVFDPAKYGKPINGNIKYGSTLETRVGITPLESACDCKPKGGFTIPRDKKE